MYKIELSDDEVQKVLSGLHCAILNAQESEIEDCHDCEFKSNACRNQCMELETIHNPNLK